MIYCNYRKGKQTQYKIKEWFIMIITRENVFDYVSKTVNEFTGAETFTSTDGRFQIIASKAIGYHGPHDLMTLWKKDGSIGRELNTYICVGTYYTDENNRCTSIYNATVKRNTRTHRDFINFDYIKEWTEENIIDIVIACLNMREEGIEAIFTDEN